MIFIITVLSTHACLVFDNITEVVKPEGCLSHGVD